MKKILPLFYLLALLPSISAFSQKYKNVEDTVKLNKEYLRVSNDIASLHAKLTIAQNDLPAYQSSAMNANNNASNAATASSDQATKATNGSIKEAKRAKKKARKAYGEAKDSRAANSKVNNLQNKITRYQSDLVKKEKRLEELEAMRNAINLKAGN